MDLDTSKEVGFLFSISCNVFDNLQIFIFPWYIWNLNNFTTCYYKSLTHKTFFSRDVVVNLGKKNLKLGLKGHPLIIDGEFEAAIKVEESAWVLEDKRTLVLSIGKSRF